MEISNFVMRIIKDDILEQFFITKEKFKSENYSLFFNLFIIGLLTNKIKIK